MNQKKKFPLSKITLLSLVTFLLSILLASLIIKSKKEPASKSITTKTPKVSTTTIRPATHPIVVPLYGTAKAAQSVLFTAPFSEKVKALRELVVGLELQAGEQLFQMNEENINLSIEELQTQVEQLQSQKTHLLSEKKILEERIALIENQLVTSTNSYETQKKNFQVEKQLFDKSLTLKGKKIISETEHLTSQKSYQQAEVAALEAKKALTSNKDLLKQLELNRISTTRNLDDLVYKTKILETQIKQLMINKEKAKISVDFPSTIVELFVDKEQEVTQGTSLASVRSNEEIEIELSIPDSYLKWIYRGGLFNHATTPQKRFEEITIQLVNQSYPQKYSNGKIKSIGESFNSTTRSLPLIISRKNPILSNNPHEKLSPGVYCKVSLPIDEAKKSYLIKRQALQQGNRLYTVESMPNKKSGTLKIIDNISILFEREDGLIIEIPTTPEELQIVEHELRFASDGMKVEIEEQEI